MRCVNEGWEVEVWRIGLSANTQATTPRHIGDKFEWQFTVKYENGLSMQSVMLTHTLVCVCDCMTVCV